MFLFGGKSLSNPLRNMRIDQNYSSPLGPRERKLSLPSSQGGRDYVVSEDGEQILSHTSSIWGCQHSQMFLFQALVIQMFLTNQGVMTLNCLFIQSAVSQQNFKIR